MRVRQLLPRDAIPSLDAPGFGEAYFGDDEDDVVVVEPADGPARAYPLRVLHYHEVVNDVVPATSRDVTPPEVESADGRPIAVTWCPICASAVVYDRRVDGGVLEFGVSGKLADDDLVLYDRVTGSEWKQSSGECIAGDHEGRQLDLLPAGMVSYRRFRAAHPDGLVLDPAASDSPVVDADGARRHYDARPYDAYFAADGFGYEAMQGFGTRAWDREDIAPKTTVLGLGDDDDAIGVPYPVAREAGGVLTVDPGGGRTVVVATDTAFHAFEAPGFDLELNRDDLLVGDGTTWNPATGESDDGRRLQRVPTRRLYAFAWQDDHGPDAFYGC